MDNILVASNDSQWEATIVPLLEAQGFEVVIAHDGLQAHQLALEKQPALVIVDLQLDVYNGIETTQILRTDPEISLTLPILLVGNEPPSAKQLEQVQATGFLQKAQASLLLPDLLVEYLRAYGK